MAALRKKAIIVEMNSSRKPESFAGRYFLIAATLFGVVSIKKSTDCAEILAKIRHTVGRHMAKAFGSYGDFHGFTLDDVKGMSSEEQVDMIVEWFNYHFEDPQNDTPYNKDLGGYAFLWGGPFDANETIQDFFRMPSTLTL